MTEKIYTTFSRGSAVQRDTVRINLEKSPNCFVVKKRASVYDPRIDDEDRLERAEFDKSFILPSTSRLEVYRVDPNHMESAMAKMRSSAHRAVEWCAHVYQPERGNGDLLIPTERIYVEIAEEADSRSVNALLEKYGLEASPTPEFDEEGYTAFMLSLTSAARENPIKIANDLREQRDIRVAEPNFYVPVELQAYYPDDPLFNQQWHLENRGGIGLTKGADVSAPEAWAISRGDSDVTVCVIDDGFDLDHPDFNSENKVRHAFDFGNNRKLPTPQSREENHGTACAGVAVADENGIGTIGIAPKCGLMPVGLPTHLDDNGITDLFEHARRNGADVISCSWGADVDGFVMSTQMRKVISRAAREGRNGKGSVVVFAAGNHSEAVSGFALHPDVITVSASNSHDRRSHYSNFGDAVWICAPSSGAGGRPIITTDRLGGMGYASGDYTTSVNGFGGTSSSTPLVAGIAALMLSANPMLTSAEIKEIMRKTAVKIDPSNGKYSPQGHSPYYGWGRIDAHACVSKATDMRDSTALTNKAYTSTRYRDIPDNNAKGVSDTILVKDQGRITSMEVQVNIAHPYRGDLQVKLQAPNGEVVVLHSRSGGSQDNLRKRFTLSTTPALAKFVQNQMAGEWQLTVADLAKHDDGALEGWSLHFKVDQPTNNTWMVEPNAEIPDNDPNGIVSEVEVKEKGKLKSISVSVDITHPWRGDLQVFLISPSGEHFALYTGHGGSADDLKQTFNVGNRPQLRTLLDGNTDIKGTWKLKVADLHNNDVGTFNRWSLTLER